MNTPASSGWMSTDFRAEPALPAMSSSSKIFTDLCRSRCRKARALRSAMGSPGSSCTRKYSVIRCERSGQSTAGDARIASLMRANRSDAAPGPDLSAGIPIK